MVLRMDSIQFTGITRWAHESLYECRQRAKRKLEKKLKEGNWVSSIKLCHEEQFGWTIRYLKLLAKHKDSPIDILVIDAGDGVLRYYYHYDEAIVIMKIIDEKFSSSQVLNNEIVNEYLTSKSFADKLEEFSHGSSYKS